jgi:lysozyme
MAKKQSGGSSFLAWLFIFLGIGFISLLVFLFIKNRGNKFIYYKEFGVEVPINYTVHGIDVSHHQQRIEWEAVSQMNVRGIKVKFAFIKAIQGLTLTDSRFEYNWKQSKRFGILRGAYHFFHPSRDGAEQARRFIAHVGPLQPGDLPPVLDIEVTDGVSKEKLQAECKQWLNLIEKEYKVKPIIYSNVDFYENYLGAEFNDYPFWAAHYFEKEKPRTSRNWNIWQHTEKAHISGISTPVDFNVFNGDLFALKRMTFD